jgi:predicted AAA+ superfamily ATPase
LGIFRVSHPYHAGKDFYRTASGTEIDLILEKGQRKIAVEFKASVVPVLSQGFWIALDELRIDEAYVIAPVKESYPLRQNVQVVPLENFIRNFSR